MRVSVVAVMAIFGTWGVACLTLASGRGVAGASPSAAAEAARSEPSNEQPVTPVLVELFTSEGCSDCPPADRLLARLEQTQPVPGAQIIALEQHVDYWNRLGWTDPFSSAQFSDRQAGYVRSLHADSAYTPQMIVDGVTQFVGSGEREALAAIAKAARTPKARVALEQSDETRAEPGRAPLLVRVGPLAGTGGEGADVFLAITEDGLASNVTRGENSGAQLSHRAVVRSLQILGQVRPGGSFSAAPDLRLARNWKREKLRAVVFVQASASRRIFGAAAVSLFASNSRP
ncbi:MAG TPA: DUF1223 domain-containing protein [Candidatus Acidoferrales bacterium]|nr:DUF1223 domain-containing protein [Candidatus Acidoferrales bacterium]